MEIKMKRYKPIEIEPYVSLISEASFSTEKPKPEAGYEIKKVKKKVKGKVIVGWEKKAKKDKDLSSKAKQKTHLSKTQRKMRAKKAVKTKKRDITGQKKAIKKAKATRKLNV